MIEKLTIALAGLLILGYGLMCGYAIVQVLRTSSPPPPPTSEGLLNVLTSVASLVGGIVAVAFGITSQSVELLAHGSPQEKLMGIYALVYVLAGVCATVTWVTKSAVTSTVVKNLATTFLGLALPIVTAFFARQSLVTALTR
jgi:hypothetical protein